MKELNISDFIRVRPLFRGFDYSLSLEAAIQGNNPGIIFVDDVENPGAAFALTVEGYLLTGDPENPAHCQALQRLLQEKIFTGKVYVNGDESLSLAVYPDAWETRLSEIIPGYEIEKLERHHYLCRELKSDAHRHVPEGYTLRRLDADLISDPGIELSEDIGSWEELNEMWGTIGNFLARGCGFCVLHGDQVVSKCAADCVAGDQIDIGIVTHPAYRRQGLAAAAVAATVEHCFQKGFTQIGWHCNLENTASWKLAEKVGFQRNREYAYYYYMYDPIDHLAELGWYHFRRGQPEKTVQYYEQVFAQRADNPDYYYHLTAVAWARRGNKEKALKYLFAAADHGWTAVEWTRSRPEFSILHGLPDWELVLRRMARGAENEPDR